MTIIAPRPPQPNHAPSERDLREDLAAAYRLIARFGMDDLIYTHLSARLPGAGEPRFLINPYGMMFSEITASSLVVVDVEGNAVGEQIWPVNPAGFVIHSAIHMGREDAHCVMHTHTLAGMAVAATEDGILPLNQMSMEFYGRVAVHEYEGIAADDNLSERGRLVRDLGSLNCALLRNHGLLTVGATVAEAFYYMYYLEQACRIQLAATSMGRTLSIPPVDVIERARDQFSGGTSKGWRPWAALRRMLDREDPSYRD
ncbi:class II aldolase/adducin family protein [Elioraea rosea]|uniref:class II aldolase/adducin family protein n=1 Tax=Elioraea rosea TaxID=2492390 RepID=UPI00118352EB|nr:class II aldolase/adducin family protein [Elioraea rosea]